MQKIASSQVTTGAVAPSIVGPTGSTKLHYVGIGLVLLGGIASLAFWFTAQPGKATDTAFISKELSPPLAKPSVDSPSIPAQPVPPTIRTVDPPSVLHDDVYFEVGRRGLTDEGRIMLQKRAEFLKANPDWGVLIQGHTDQQGSDSYNQVLGLKRAESVKQYLVGQGVADTSIKVVSLGKAGALCADTSDRCRQMNRRVHLELRNIGVAHMSLPAPVAAQPATARFDEGTDVEPQAHTASSVESDSSTLPVLGTEPEASESSPNQTP